MKVSRIACLFFILLLLHLPLTQSATDYLLVKSDVGFRLTAYNVNVWFRNDFTCSRIEISDYDVIFYDILMGGDDKRISAFMVSCNIPYTTVFVYSIYKDKTSRLILEGVLKKGKLKLYYGGLGNPTLILVGDRKPRYQILSNKTIIIFIDPIASKMTIKVSWKTGAGAPLSLPPSQPKPEVEVTERKLIEKHTLTQLTLLLILLAIIAAAIAIIALKMKKRKQEKKLIIEIKP